MNKDERQKKIIKIITDNEITTQDELVEKLKESGMMITQATVSRDIKELGITKGRGLTRKFKYIVSEKSKSYGYNTDLLSKFLKSCESSQNIIVCKTPVGCAQTACAIVDEMNIPDVLGSIAGDDCFMMVCRPFAVQGICEVLEAYIND